MSLLISSTLSKFRTPHIAQESMQQVNHSRPSPQGPPEVPGRTQRVPGAAGPVAVRPPEARATTQSKTAPPQPTRPGVPSRPDGPRGGPGGEAQGNCVARIITHHHLGEPSLQALAWTCQDF